MINLTAMDMGLSIGFFAIFALFGSLDYATVFSLAPFMNETAITIIGLLVFTGAMAKSAQIPLHSWLPLSMEGKIKLRVYTLFYKNLLSLIFLFILVYLVIYLMEINLIEDTLYYTSCSSIPSQYVRLRDSSGRFVSKIKYKKVPEIPLPLKVKKAMIGELLGDGHLRYTKKGVDGLPKPNANAHFAITLKSKDHIMYLWEKIYNPICTSTEPNPWPNPNSGRGPVTQYQFASRTLKSISKLHKEWYIFNEDTKKFRKIVPLNIGEELTALGLAHWLMGDGYWYTSDRTVEICTDSFTEIEVELLIKVLKDNFDLVATKKRRIKANKEVCWRIRLSSVSPNISHLRTLVKRHFIPAMYYKLGLSSESSEF
jgi:hypothetical protein